MIIHTTTLDTMEKVIAIYGGTTWEKIEGMFLLGASGSYEINSTGGETNHTLTETEIPAHRHWVWKNPIAGVGSGEYGEEAYLAQSILTANGTFGKTSSTGGNKPHNNMPPYKVVYIWERIS